MSDENFKNLKEKAEHLLKKDPDRWLPADRSQDEIIHDLQIHQIELELQNEELKSIQYELEKTRDRYINLYDFSPVGYFTLDKDATILEGNLTGADYLGFERTVIIGSDFRKYIDPESQDTFYFHLREVLDSAEKHQTEVRIRHRDGTVPVRLESMARKDTDNKNTIKMILLDISEQKRAEEELIAAKDRAEAANRTKSQFLANVSHELRTPLNGISGMINLLTGTELSDKQKQYLSMLETSLKTLTGLINDLLDISQIEAGRLTIESEEFRFSDIMNTIVSTYTTHSRIKGLDFVFNSSLDLDLFKGDPLRVHQIVTNLVTNAIKYTEEGRVKLEVSMEREEDGRAWVAIVVSDTGMGISKKDMHSIFDSFTRVGDSYTRDHSGIGLGLAIVKQLIDAMGGSISVQSEVGRGSAFTVTLPLDIVYGERAAAEETEEEILQIAGARVLVVEDEAINKIYIVNYLKEQGMEVDTAKNGIEALEKMNANNYDVVLMDIRMPKMNGIEATEKFRSTEQKGHLPIIALSAHSYRQDIDNCINAGMDDYITKPVQNRELLTKISSHIHR